MRTVVMIVCLAAVLGCQGKKKESPRSGSAAASTSEGSGAAVAEQPGAPVLTLPKLSGTPPKKSSGPLDPAASARMVALEFPGFKKDVRSDGPPAIEIRHVTEQRPFLQVTIQARSCGPCTPMDLAAWQARTEQLKQGMREQLRKSPDTIFEIGQSEISGQPLIYVYQLGFASEKDENDNPVTSATNAYTLHYNDGVNMVSVAAAYMDNPRSAAGMAELAPKEDLARIAKAFLDAYTHAW